MGMYIFKRFIYSLFVLITVSIVVFFMVHAQPGNPYRNMVTADSDPEFVEKRMEEMGYNNPLPIQYIKWIKELIKGNFGYSIKYHVAVKDMISQRLKNTFLLTITSFFIMIFFSVMIGILSAYKKGTFFEITVTMISFVIISIPAFFLSLILIKVFSYELKILPPSGMSSAGKNYIDILYVKDLVLHMIMPVFIIVLIQSASTIRYIQTATLQILSQSFIQMNRARGMSKIRVLWKHVLANILVPIITILCMRLPSLISGVVIIEAIFVWPGIGTMMQEAVLNSDYPLIMGTTMVLAIVVIISNLISDILCQLVHPKMRIGGEWNKTNKS